MAYPSSPVVFAVHNADDVVQPSHVNDLQTEVTALESALLTGGLAHNLNPATDNARNLGSSAARWIFNGSQITPGSIPSTTLSTTGTPSSVTYLTGTGWAAAANAIYSLIGATSGTDATAAAANVATFAISGLTTLDSLKVFVRHSASSQATAEPVLYNATDSVVIAALNNGNVIAAGAFGGASVEIMADQTASTAILASVVALATSTTAGASVNGASYWQRSAFVTKSTAAWDLALRTGAGGVTAGGTYHYKIAVYKVAGQ